jgi:hypothetical protein
MKGGGKMKDYELTTLIIMILLFPIWIISEVVKGSN